MIIIKAEDENGELLLRREVHPEVFKEPTALPAFLLEVTTNIGELIVAAKTAQEQGRALVDVRRELESRLDTFVKNELDKRKKAQGN
jgi:hypothetical protein